MTQEEEVQVRRERGSRRDFLRKTKLMYLNIMRGHLIITGKLGLK